MKLKSAWVVIIAMSLPFAKVQAQNLILQMQNGADQSYSMSDLQKITFCDNNIVLNFQDGTSMPFGLSSLEKLYFSSTSPVKEIVVQQADIYYNTADHQLYIKNLPEGGSAVSVYRSDGREIIRTTVSGSGSIDVSPFPKSLYLVRVNNKVLKFVK
jgi:hypothetical protein